MKHGVAPVHGERSGFAGSAMKGAPQRAPRGARERSQRQLRVGEMLRHALVAVLTQGAIRDPELAGVSVTVTEVRVSADLRNATAYVVPLGGGNMDAVVGALRRAAPYLRRLLAGHVTTRRLPALCFEPDISFDRFERIGRLLDRSAAAGSAPVDGQETGNDEP